MPNDRITGREAKTSPQVAAQVQSVTGGASVPKPFFKKLLGHENLFIWVTAGARRQAEPLVSVGVKRRLGAIVARVQLK